MLRLLVISIWVLILAVPTGVYARDVPTRKVEDDSALRIALLNSWFSGAPDRVLAQKPVVSTLAGGARVQVRAEAEGAVLRIILARELNGSYPGWAQGSWVLNRRRDSGAIERIQLFLRSDRNVYVQFRPFSTDKCLMDVVAYNAYLVYALSLPFSLERLLVLPVEEALRTAGSQFPRRYFEPDPASYRDIRTLISRVRHELPELTFGDDGAIDESGHYVFINDLQPQPEINGLNCSGFAKWLVDGMIRPFTGKLLAIPPLKKPFGSRGTSFTEPFERLRDPYFGLDWTRNLASIAGTVLLSSPALGRLEEIEVQKCPFTRLIVKNIVRSYPSYLSDAGFGFEGLQPLLYTLAIDEPGYIYLASVNNDGGTPSMRTHFHVAALMPYFDEQGDFQITVFESAEETSFAYFNSRYPGHFVNLVRIPVEGVFDPRAGLSSFKNP